MIREEMQRAQVDRQPAITSGAPAAINAHRTLRVQTRKAHHHDRDDDQYGAAMATHLHDASLWRCR
jgi:hypothetical protein